MAADSAGNPAEDLTDSHNEQVYEILGGWLKSEWSARSNNCGRRGRAKPFNKQVSEKFLDFELIVLCFYFSGRRVSKSEKFSAPHHVSLKTFLRGYILLFFFLLNKSTVFHSNLGNHITRKSQG